MVPCRLTEAPDSRELDHHSDSIEIAAHEGTQPRRHIVGQTRIHHPLLRHGWYRKSFQSPSAPIPNINAYPCRFSLV